MDPVVSALTSEERTLLKLRALYRQYGYAQYRMSKFEEYDLYAGNKDFLVSENVLTRRKQGFPCFRKRVDLHGPEREADGS